MSSLIVAKSGNRSDASPGPGPGSGGAGGSNVPLVRATSPGAEIREEKRLAAQRKEKEERLRKAVYEPSSQSPAAAASAAPSPIATRDGVRDSPSASPGKPIRRFQISRTSTTTPMNLHRSFDGGVQKRKGAGGDGVAVLVEKLRKTHSRQASQDVFGANLDGTGAGAAAAAAGEDAAGSGTEARPRKRPVVNQAERKWREERKNAISAAKENISNAMDRSAQARGKDRNWDDESDRLAGEFERIALELDAPSPVRAQSSQPPTEAKAESKPTPSTFTSKPLKYQPRTPNKPRNATKPEKAEKAEGEDTDSEDDYVYDVYVRRPLTQAQAQAESQSRLQPPSQPQFQSRSLPTNFKNPLAELENQNALLSANVGVIVITQEDEIYWENFIEDEDDEEWDSEDADSNGMSPLFLLSVFICNANVIQLRITLRMITPTKNCHGMTRTTTCSCGIDRRVLMILAQAVRMAMAMSMIRIISSIHIHSMVYKYASIQNTNRVSVFYLQKVIQEDILSNSSKQKSKRQKTAQHDSIIINGTACISAVCR